MIDKGYAEKSVYNVLYCLYKINLFEEKSLIFRIMILLIIYFLRNYIKISLLEDFLENEWNKHFAVFHVFTVFISEINDAFFFVVQRREVK